MHIYIYHTAKCTHVKTGSRYAHSNCLAHAANGQVQRHTFVHVPQYQLKTQDLLELEKYIETALSKMSKTHDLIGRLESYAGHGNGDSRAKKLPAKHHSPRGLVVDMHAGCMHRNCLNLRACDNLEAKLKEVEQGHDKLVEIHATVRKQQITPELLDSTALINF